MSGISLLQNLRLLEQILRVSLADEVTASILSTVEDIMDWLGMDSQALVSQVSF